MEHDPIQNDVRRARRERVLGPDAACALCGVTTPEALLRVDRSLLQAHHVLSEAIDDTFTVPVCRNCHAILTEGQLRQGCAFQPQRTIPECLIAIFAHLCALFLDLAALFTMWRGKVTGFVGGLDMDYPDWRNKAWARV
jgi:hypothetical protein